MCVIRHVVSFFDLGDDALAIIVERSGFDFAGHEEVRDGRPALRGALRHDAAERGGNFDAPDFFLCGSCDCSCGAGLPRLHVGGENLAARSEPCTVASSTPNSFARRRAFGEIFRARLLLRLRDAELQRCGVRLVRPSLAMQRARPGWRARFSRTASPGATIHAMICPTGMSAPADA